MWLWLCVWKECQIGIQILKRVMERSVLNWDSSSVFKVTLRNVLKLELKDLCRDFNVLIFWVNDAFSCFIYIFVNRMFRVKSRRIEFAILAYVMMFLVVLVELCCILLYFIPGEDNLLRKLLDECLKVGFIIILLPVKNWLTCAIMLTCVVLLIKPRLANRTCQTFNCFWFFSAFVWISDRSLIFYCFLY